MQTCRLVGKICSKMLLLIIKYQFGYRKSHSTEQTIMEITDNLTASIDSNLLSCGLFLDISKAFDKVNH